MTLRRCQNVIIDAAISNVKVVSRRHNAAKTTTFEKPHLRGKPQSRLRSAALKKSSDEKSAEKDDDARKPQPEPENWEYKYLYDGACPVCRSLKAGLEGTTDLVIIASHSCCLTEHNARLFVGDLLALFLSRRVLRVC